MTARRLPLLLLVLVVTFASPVFAALRCPFAFPDGRSIVHAPVNIEDRQAIFKLYLRANLLYPQRNEMIITALAASQLLNIEAWQAFRNLKYEEILVVWRAMNNAHAVHGVAIERPPERVARLMNGFSFSSEQAVGQLIRFIMFYDHRTRTEGLADWYSREAFFNQPEFEYPRQLLTGYSKTILGIMLSPEMTPASVRIRELAAQGRAASVPLAEAIGEVKRVIQNGLEAKHPELRKPFHTLMPEYRSISTEATVGYILVQIIGTPPYFDALLRSVMK